MSNGARDLPDIIQTFSECGINRNRTNAFARISGI